jgi:hypothetical protein
MAQYSQTSNGVGWLEASGLLHILRTLGMAVHPAKLSIGLVAIFLTFVLGGLLDWVWSSRGGVEEAAITKFIQSKELDAPYEEGAGDHGIFEVWREHERQCVLGFLGSSVPGASVAAGTPVGTYVESHSYARPLRNFIRMVYGVWWMLRHHVVYFALFAIGALLIWSWCGGAMCRIAAVQFARDEKLTMRQGFAYAREKLFGGFFLSPCIPLAFIVITLVLMVVGGMVLRIPVLGDLIGGLAFPLAILGGFVISILLLGLLVGGSLFWPAVAVEGSDAFDSFSRGLSYPLSKPLKAILYAIITIVYASICWVFVNLFTFCMLSITRLVVGFGTSPFGLWSRGSEGQAVSKLDLLWPLSGPNALYAWPEWNNLAWHEYFSAFFIGVFVLITIGLMWSFLASFYFSASTTIYYLLRRDVDGTDLEDVFTEEEEGDEAAAGGAAVPPSPGAEVPAEPADEGAPPADESKSGESAESDDSSPSESPETPSPGAQ